MEFFDINQKILVSILSAGIRNVQPALSCGNNVDWQAVTFEAARHKVTALVYYSMIQCNGIQVPDNIKEEFRKYSLYEIAEQDKNYLAFGEILRKLTFSNISVIVLKGLFLRDLYHDPCLRSMCDYDVLIRSDDFEKVAVIMENAGYEKVYDKDKHVAYVHSRLMRVEFHKTLISTDRYENLAEFEEKVWKDVIPTKVSGVKVLSLSPTDHAVYLVLHMATHTKGGGFGLRQLCDWVLFIETYEQEIDWNTFDRYIKSMGMEIFTQALFETCRQFFNLEVPQGWRTEDKSQQEVVNSLIQDIFDSGVFGKDGRDRITANRMIYYTGGAEAKTPKQKMRALFILLFPKAEKLDVRFEYARKHRFLLPVAWLHRFVHTIVRKDIDIFEKISVLRPKRAAEICTNRSLLLEQLGLLKK